MTVHGANDPLLLDEQICFALYNASRALTARYRELLEPLGVTYPQYLVLLVLWQTDRVSVGQLGERLHLDSGTLSPLVRRLEAAGLLTRTRMPEDERTVRVSLTAAGLALRAKAAHIPEQICAATGLDLADLKALQVQVVSVAEHVRSAVHD
ncbi:MarR family winged helix-turn-helix transcriptional regulator [Subtercola frigoramans]|uniref:DNA-binding MarR family transcriptional regulator n=1 Tax=Subtercola frigoramans TaxID=120298 RepID=A0ABS2L0Y6_9MICO|nr:MarR family transcriptional regulator [Subtercola frigoramans]MBM7470733.1 DNA-binding MarR family transcriptional regulator [Subtercola frigoramans]